MGNPRILIVVGSLRAASINRRLAAALAHLLQDRAWIELAELGALPLYNQDHENPFPAPAQAFREQVAAADALLFVTPEYNRSIPGVLKNALDIGSRPYGQSVWAGKPAAVCGASPGVIGTALAQQHLRNVLSHLDVAVLPQPELFFKYEDGVIAEDGSITNPRTASFLQGFADRFIGWVCLHRG